MDAKIDGIELPIFPTLGAFPTVRLGDTDLCAEFRPPDDGMARTDYFLPTIEVWLLGETTDSLPELGGGCVVTTEPGIREDLDTVIFRLFSNAKRESGVQFAIPAALANLTASAAARTHLPVFLATSVTTEPLEPQWWARTPATDADLTVAIDSEDLVRATTFLVARSVDVLDDDDYFN